MKILLIEWGKRNYTPAPSDWTLQRMARAGQIHPPPEKVGQAWYVEEDAKRIAPTNEQK